MYFTKKANFYMTRKVSECVDQELINIMLSMIAKDNLNGVESDYFKVFQFSNIEENGVRYLLVKETQEQPEYEAIEKFAYADDEENLFESDEPLTLWVISDGECDNQEVITFLFSDEY